jgi:SAM-dependent methyltransferase
MSFGLLHFGRPEVAVAEVRRVLRRGGRFAFTVWASPERAAGFALILEAIREHGDLSVPLPPGPPVFRFSERDECLRLFQEAAFARPTVSLVPQTLRLSNAGDLLRAFEEGSVRTRALIRGQRPEALAAIRTAVSARARKYTTERAIEIPMPAVLAAAEKP